MPDVPASGGVAGGASRSSDGRVIKRRRGARVIVLARFLSRSPARNEQRGRTKDERTKDELHVLLQGDTDPGLPGSRFWQTPGGGIDDGESPREAVARELFEETGLAVDPETLGEPVATRTVTHGYSDRILIQHETYFRLEVEMFEPVNAALTEAEARRRVTSGWFPLDALPENVWPAELATLARHDGYPVDLGEVEESTVPATSQT